MHINAKIEPNTAKLILRKLKLDHKQLGKITKIEWNSKKLKKTIALVTKFENQFIRQHQFIISKKAKANRILTLRKMDYKKSMLQT